MIDPIVVHGKEDITALPGDTLSAKGDGLHDSDLTGIDRLSDLEELYFDGCQGATRSGLGSFQAERPEVSVELT